LRTQLYEKREAMKIVGVAACTVGIAHTYMAQKAIQDECAARGIECKVEAQGGLGIENELTQEDVDSADLVLESVDVGVENEDRFEQKMAEGKFLKVGTSDVIADPVKIIDQAVEIIKATGGAVDASKAEAKAEKKAVSAAPQAPTPASKQSIFADPGKTLLNAFNTGVSYFIPIVVIGGVFLAFSLASGTAGASGMEVTNPLMVSLNTIGMAGISMMIPVLAAYIPTRWPVSPHLPPASSWATWLTTPSSPRAATAFRPASWAP
jgi:fructose PTS system EIIBC or EIIC component